MNLGIIDVHTEVSAIFGREWEFAYVRALEAGDRIGGVNEALVSLKLRPSPKGLKRNVVFIAGSVDVVRMAIKSASTRPASAKVLGALVPEAIRR